MIRPFRGVLPRIHPTAYIDSSAQIIGDVEIGEESSVWMGVVIRGDVHWIRVGRRSNVQDGTVVHVMKETHATTIGDDVTIGHRALVHGCTIGDRCLIGMGAILLNGAQIGTGSVVAAGSLVVEGMQVPPGSLVMGSPAKVKRPLRPEEIANIQMYADRYVGYRLDYMRSPQPPRSAKARAAALGVGPQRGKEEPSAAPQRERASGSAGDGTPRSEKGGLARLE